MGEMHDAWFFVGVLVFIFLIWIATGGPTHPISFTGPMLDQPEELGGGTYLQLPRAPFMVNRREVTLRGYSSSGSSNTGYSNTEGSLYGISFGPPSTYQGMVTMSHSVSNASSTDPNTEYVKILSTRANVPISISNWRLVSAASGKSAFLPLGTTVPTFGVVNPTQNIVLAPGERAQITSGRSPIGVSFRENKCTGYLNTFQEFTPSLPRSCPNPSDELASFYGQNYVRDASCIDYVAKLPRCETVLFPPSRRISATCKSFVLQRLNYNSCVSVHKYDPDFNGDTWHIYIGLTKPLWRGKHEVVKLLDASGKTVDAFSY